MNPSKIYIDQSSQLQIEDIVRFARNRKTMVELAEDSNFKMAIQRNHEFLLSRLKAGDEIYGVSTGYGNSCSNRFDDTLALKLPANLVKYHGCGVGDSLSEEICAASLLIRLITNSRAKSGVSYELLSRMAQFCNSRLIPVIPELGSVGASGDLTPLSYLAASLQGDRKVYDEGIVRDTSDALNRRGISRYDFKPKEALALMNGTAVMTAIASLAWTEAKKLAELSSQFTGLLVEVLGARSSPFEEKIHSVKPHPGQKFSAQIIYSFLNNPDERRKRNSSVGEHNRLQESYSIRCAPQVVGVLFDVLKWSKEWIEIEINSVNDNPVIFDREELILNGGHFFGGHIASAVDSLKTAVANVLNLMDKQMAILVDSRFSRSLPDNLVATQQLGNESAIHHGFKAMQITLSAVTAEALKKSIPMSIFSRSTESMNQDVVSMGTIAARDLDDILKLAKIGSSIYAMALRQACFLRGDVLKLNSVASQFHSQLAEVFKPVIEDRPLDIEISKMADFLFSKSENPESL